MYPLANPICPRCQSARTDRRKRSEWLHRFFFHHFGLFPWVCNQCHHQFNFNERGKRKKRHAGESESPVQAGGGRSSSAASLEG